MLKPASAIILYDKLKYKDDAAVVDRLLQSKKCNVLHLDIREPHQKADIQIHVRIPIYSAVSWACKNILLAHPDDFKECYIEYSHAFEVYNMADKWCSWMDGPGEDPKNDFVCFVDSSRKYEYVANVIPFWNDDDPHLTIYSHDEEFVANLKKINANNVLVIHKELTRDALKQVCKLHRGHLVCSHEETVDYYALHADAVGAFTIANDLTHYKRVFKNKNNSAWIITEQFSTIRTQLDEAFSAFHASNLSVPTLFSEVCDAFIPLLEFNKDTVLGTPILQITDCPPISIITPTYNRKHLIDIAFHNLLISDYPQEKIEWIIVEDNEKKENMATDKIINFQVHVPKIVIKYIPIEGHLSIGEKRNYGIKHATHDTILFMDDDDHYPETSFRRRVAWLSKGDIVCCSTLPLYDLKNGTSAISIPPFHLPLSQRISEATLTFKKSAWEERPFADVSIAEAESWIKGREFKVVEIPPQQIIIAFTHGKNQSSRVVPGAEPSCFWGFSDEYLKFIHQLAGIQVE